MIKKILKINKEIKNEIKSCFQFAKKSKFPNFKSWEDLNLLNEKKKQLQKNYYLPLNQKN